MRRLSSAPGAAAAPAITPASPRLLPCDQRDRPLVPRGDRGDAGGHGRGTCWLKGTAHEVGIAFAGLLRPADGIPPAQLPGPVRGCQQLHHRTDPLRRWAGGRRGNLPCREPTQAHVLAPPPRSSSCARLGLELVTATRAAACFLPAGQGSAFMPPAGSTTKASLSAEGEDCWSERRARCLPQPPLASLGHFSCVNTSLHAPLQRRATLSRLRVIMNIPPAISTGCWKSLFSR